NSDDPCDELVLQENCDIEVQQCQESGGQDCSTDHEECMARLRLSCDDSNVDFETTASPSR
uniref:Attractin n=1 Tax=Bursatella leachii TaxID=6508 RepID=P84512_BURLE|nr:attractin - Bursatella leachii [Bursatella leachii]